VWTNGGVFGKPDFIREMKEKFKIKLLRGRGKPKKDKNKEEKNRVDPIFPHF